MDSKARAKAVQAAFTEFVKQRGAEFGVKLGRSSARYGEAEIVLRLTLEVTDEGAQRAAFARDARLFGVKPEAFGARLDNISPGYAGGTLVGFTAGRKFPVRVRMDNGKEMVLVTHVLRRLHPSLREEWAGGAL